MKLLARTATEVTDFNKERRGGYTFEFTQAEYDRLVALLAAAVQPHVTFDYLIFSSDESEDQVRARFAELLPLLRQEPNVPDGWWAKEPLEFLPAPAGYVRLYLPIYTYIDLKEYLREVAWPDSGVDFAALGETPAGIQEFLSELTRIGKGQPERAGAT
jgi:hypothetical protein